MNKNNKPSHFLALKIIGFAGVLLAITGAFLVFYGFGDFDSNNFMIGGFMVSVGFMLGFTGLIFGFYPEITRNRRKRIT